MKWCSTITTSHNTFCHLFIPASFKDHIKVNNACYKNLEMSFLEDIFTYLLIYLGRLSHLSILPSYTEDRVNHTIINDTLSSSLLIWPLNYWMCVLISFFSLGRLILCYFKQRNKMDRKGVLLKKPYANKLDNLSKMDKVIKTHS